MAVLPTDTEALVTVALHVRVLHSTLTLLSPTSSVSADDGVFVTGNASQLGAWDLTKAGRTNRMATAHSKKLTRSFFSVNKVPLTVAKKSSDETQWTVTLRVPPSTPLEYKYLIRNRVTGAILSWEAIPANRTLIAARGRNVAL